MLLLNKLYFSLLIGYRNLQIIDAILLPLMNNPENLIYAENSDFRTLNHQKMRKPANRIKHAIEQIWFLFPWDKSVPTL